MSKQSTLSVDSLKNLSIEEFLVSILQQKSTITVQFPTGEAVVIQPKQVLLPLPILDGYVPQGWKDAIY